MGCGPGGCSSGGCSTGGCNKLNTFDWLAVMDLPPHMKPFNILEVRFKGTRKDFYTVARPDDFTINDIVVVETENGYDIGKVSLKGELVKIQLRKNSRSEDSSFRKILRKANEADIARYKENQELEVPTMYKARSIAMELGLTMKLSDVEYQGDRRKATFYYTADERVDFRELIKRLAESFKVRIEMRQIGYRHEAARLGAIGSCGRELCCSTWLTDFKVVGTSAARYQNLSLNPLKLNGQCGKLKCCLNFELDSYMEALREFPSENTVTLQFAENRVFRSVKTDILKRLMWFAPQTELGGEWISLPVKKVNEYLEMNRNGEKPELVIPDKKPVRSGLPELEFKNDMGTGSLNRLDDRERKNRFKNKNKSRNAAAPQKNAGPRPPQENRRAESSGTENTTPTGNQQRPNNNQNNNQRSNNGSGNNRNNNRNRNNRNNNNPNNKPNPNTPA